MIFERIEFRLELCSLRLHLLDFLYADFFMLLVLIYFNAIQLFYGFLLLNTRMQLSLIISFIYKFLNFFINNSLVDWNEHVEQILLLMNFVYFATWLLWRALNCRCVNSFKLGRLKMWIEAIMEEIVITNGVS